MRYAVWGMGYTVCYMICEVSCELCGMQYYISGARYGMR